MKTYNPIRNTALILIVLLAGTLTSRAAITVQGWWHLDSTQPTADSSGNARPFGSAFSNHPNSGGQVNALLVNNGAGGPLGSSGWTSTQCVRLGYLGVDGHARQSSMWGIGYVPPSTNFGIEIWARPQNTGFINGNTWYFSSGDSGGVVLRCVDNGDGTSSMVATILGVNIDVGSPALIDTNRWTHYAIVNNNGTTTFYTNGVACGTSDVGNATPSAGTVYIGTPSDNQAIDAYLDEARMFTFASGAFLTSDLLLRPAGPDIVGQPQNASVWNGGAASFGVIPSFDNSITYQWQRGNGTTLPGQTAAKLYFNTVALTDSGSNYQCAVTLGATTKTSAPPATLTVVPVNPSNVAAYRTTINAEPTLLAYFPVDSDTGGTLSNTKDGTHNGTLEGGATYDGATNTTFGQRSVSLQVDGDVQIPNNPAFEFSSGNGTIEAIVNMREGTGTEPTIFSEAQDGGQPYYVFGASKTGGSLVYYSVTSSGSPTNELSWTLPVNLIGTLTHVALVFTSDGNVTAYANGQNLGSQAQTGFGSGSGAPAWIGAVGTTTTDYRWDGTIDEVAVYGSALSQNSIQVHYSKFFYGTNTAAASIVSQPTSKTLLAGGTPSLIVQATGTLPLSYVWRTNGVQVAGATTSTLTLPPLPASSSVSCVLSVSNVYGGTNSQPIVLNFTAPPAGYPSAVMTDHPSGFWRLADGAAPTAVDSAGMNNGAYNPTGVTYSVTSILGEGGTAVTFDGIAGRAIVPVSPTLNPSGPFTVEFWGKLTAYGFWVPISSMNRPARDGGYEYYLDGNSPGYEWHCAPGGYAMLTADFTPPTVGVWYHLAGIYDGTNFVFYINGDPAGLYIDNPHLEEGGPSFVANVVKGFYIGSRSDDTHFYNGTMADVAFYNYALSQQQVRRHVFAGLASPIHMALGPVSGVVVDSKPSGSTHGGINGPLGTNAAAWVASSSDGTRTRNGVMQFNGTNGNQITLAANPDFGSFTGTIMFWMKSAGTVGTNTGGAALFDRSISFPNFGKEGDVIVQQDDGSILVQPEYYDTQVLATPPLSGGSVSDGLWHHVAYVYDQTTTGGITLYVDGTQVGSGTYTASFAWAWPAQQEIELGQSHDTSWKQFDGQMDDFRIYSRMLTSTEIASVVSTDALVDTTTLQVRFNFDAAPPAHGLGVTWTPTLALPQASPGATGPYADQPSGRAPLLVSPAGNQFFRARSP
jgi:hypothetical protein